MPASISVSNLFEAIGELSTATARQPIQSILVAEHALHGATAQSIETLREIDPSIRLVLVRDEGAPSGDSPPIASAFDAVLRGPVRGADLDRILPNGHAGQVGDESPRHAQPEQPQRDASRDAAQAPSASRSDDRASKPAQQPAPAPTVEIDITRPQPVPARQRSFPDEPLGDVDLVESILLQDGGLVDRALRLIAQQTGWNDLALHTTQAVFDGAAAAVRHGGQTFGTLVTESADARALRPWADWLGHWLALDEAHRTHKLNSMRDELTGAWNRRFFHEFLGSSLTRARQLRMPVTVMVFDIDDFKIYNDKYGHEAGDEILIETVRLLESVIRRCDRVCRIGGDEFAVIFADLEGPRAAGSAHPDEVGDIATRFQKQVTAMTFPKLSREAPGSLTISGGLATFPWDGDDPEQLLRLADQRALRSKRAGKNVITFGPEASETG